MLNINLHNIESDKSNLIPDGTVATCRLTIVPGSYFEGEYKDGWATKSKSSEAVYLAANYVLLDGEYKDRLVFTTIGLYSEKSPKYAEIGLQTMSKLVHSAYELDKNIDDPRKNIKSYGDLDGLICICQIKVRLNEYKGETKEQNDIVVLTPSSVLYQEFKLKNSKPVTTPVKQINLMDDEIPF